MLAGKELQFAAAVAAILLCLGLPSSCGLAAAASGDERQKLVIYQSTDTCLSTLGWASLSDLSPTPGFEVLAVKVASRSEAVSTALATGTPKNTLLLYVDWTPDCGTDAASITAVLPSLRDVSFGAAPCRTANLLLTAALEYFSSRVALPAQAALAILDNCPVAQRISSAAVHLSKEAANYFSRLSRLLTDRRLAGFRNFFINWPANLTENDFKSILSGGWNETWFLLSEEGDEAAGILGSGNGTAAFSMGVLSSWRTRLFLVRTEPPSLKDALLRLLQELTSKTPSSQAAYVEFQSNAAIYADSGRGLERLATYLPNGSVVMETAHAANLSDFDWSGQGQVVKVAYFQNPPFNFISGGQVTGICADILNAISPMLNISFVFLPIANETWDNVIVLLGNRSLDLSSCDLSVTWSRSQLVDFSLPWTMEFKGAVVPVIRPGLDLLRLYRPFNAWVYLVTTAAIMFGGLVMAAMAWFSPISLWNLHALHVTMAPTSAYRDEVSVKQNVWNLLGALFHQGQDFYPNSASSRTVMFFWWMVSLILLSTYTAAMVASLTVPEKVTVPDSLETLNQQGYEFLVPAGGTTLQLFEGSAPGSVYASVRDSGRLQQYSGSTPYAILTDANKKIAFVSDRTKLSAAVRNNCSSLAITGAMFSSTPLAFAVRREVVWLDRFNSALQLLVQSGMIDRLRRQYLAPSVICKSSTPDTLDLAHTAGIFGLFLVFCAAALVVLVVERVVWACGWAACGHMLAVGDKSHLGCLLALIRGVPGWADRPPPPPGPPPPPSQLPEEFRSLRWRPEWSRAPSNGFRIRRDDAASQPPLPTIVLNSSSCV